MATVSRSIYVNVQPHEAYQWWRGLTRLPGIMPDVESVEGGLERTHWKVRGPLGKTVEWDADITEDVENEAIAWQSVRTSGNDVTTSGRVMFRPAEAGTQVDVELSYEPMGGPIGEAVAKLFSDPEDKVERALEAFKEAVETGGTLSGSLGSHSAGPGTSSTGVNDVHERSPEDMTGGNAV